MDKAKAAVSSFLSKDGKHSTTVHESVAPAVQQEHVTPTRHENVTTAVDREIHHEHHHTSVQPVQDREVLAEKHEHNLAGVEHREIHHGNKDNIKPHLEAERAQFKNTREVGETQHTHAVAPTLAGEHHHHHVHETIQPVVQKETIQPHVVHTTVPIHEVHHKEPTHHSASTLPAVSMSEFKHSGGGLTGRDERVDAFEGKPRDLHGALGEGGDHIIGGQGARGSTHLTGEGEGVGHTHNGLGSNRSTHGTGVGGTGVGSTGTTHGLGGNHSTTGTHGLGGNHSTTGTHGLGDKHSTTGHSLGGTGTSQGMGHPVTSTGGTHSGTDTTGTHKKPSLMDKLNPKIDSNGDGKAGFMK